jgi:hypothetical protein
MNHTENMKRVAFAIALTTPLILTACGGGGGGSSTPPPVVVPPTQTINNFVIPALAINASVNVSTVASSGLPVTLTSMTPSVCSLSGNTVKGVSFGTCTITANQNGNASLSAATTVSSSVVVGAQVIDFRLPSLMVGEGFPLTATSTSKLAIAFTSTTPSVCTVNASVLRALSAGNCIIRATQIGNSQYSPATPLSVSTTVEAASSIVAQGTVSPPSSFPQIGSTGADSTATVEGIYTTSENGVALIDASRNIAYYDAAGILFGLLQVSGLNWSLDSSSIHYTSAAATYAGANGTFNTKDSFVATEQSFLTSPLPFSFFYDISNGFAVDQSNVAGNWVLNDGNGKIQISISPTGVMSGTYTENGGVCGITGSLTHANPSKSHNLFKVSLLAAKIANSGADCMIDSGSFQGLAAIRYLTATSNAANGLIPSLVLIIRTPTHANVWFTLYKQY